MASNTFQMRLQLAEKLQGAALLGLQRHGWFHRCAFYGGTALRILHGLPRYSEDLDFTLLAPDPLFNIEEGIQGLQEELISMGVECQVEPRSKNIPTAIESAFVKANTMKLLLHFSPAQSTSTVHPQQLTQVKLEVDTDPPQIFSPTLALVGGPVPFSITTLPLPVMMAGKVHAALCRAWQKRVKGRDWYDLIWYVGQKIPLNLRALEARLRQTGHLDPSAQLDERRAKELLLEKSASLNWAAAVADVAPFLLDPRQIEVMTPQVAERAVDRLVFE
ncbi:MAG: nucleotidyl transferase AbiEii/AbiGii toxin family protein [Chlamydiia bacterium]